jgi:hypothetical protein
MGIETSGVVIKLIFISYTLGTIVVGGKVFEIFNSEARSGGGAMLFSSRGSESLSRWLCRRGVDVGRRGTSKLGLRGGVVFKDGRHGG